MDMGFYPNKTQFVSQTYIYSHNCQRTLEGWCTLFSGLHKWRYLHTINDNQDNNYFIDWSWFYAYWATQLFFAPFPSHAKTFSFSELTLRNLSFLRRRSTNTSIRKFTLLSFFENDLQLKIFIQWSKVSQNLKARNIWPNYHNNCQQAPL